MTEEKNLAHLSEARFGTVKGKLMLFNIIEKSQVSWTTFRDKLQFVNSLKRLVFDLTEISSLKCLTSQYVSFDSRSSQRSESFYRIEFG